MPPFDYHSKMETLELTGPVFLAGPPCSGKSAAGSRLAEMLEVPFFDLDEMIVAMACMSVPEIFHRLGEEGFRELESRALEYAVNEGSVFVMALGGGCLLREENLRTVLERGTLVTLSAEMEVLLERRRLQAGSRPLAMTDEAFRELMLSRKEHYGSLRSPIDTTDLSPEKTAEIILEMLRESLS